jgi:hypothetical protein
MILSGIDSYQQEWLSELQDCIFAREQANLVVVALVYGNFIFLNAGSKIVSFM